MNEITQPPVQGPPAPYAATGPTPPSTGKRILRIAGAVLVTALAVTGGRLAMEALLDDGPADAGRYELVPPASFQGLALQESGPRVDAVKQGQGAPKKGTVPVAVVYADQAGTAQLVVSGAAGRFGDEDPGAALTGTLTSMGIKEADVTEHEAGKPDGGSMRCGTLALEGSSLPLCVWADHSSLVTVTVPVENGPVAIDVLAERARALREVMEVPAAS
ncbi:hypothetical protein [Streptomyces xanthophaeus]|uniref:Uncharacterized protein n=1 Tax=Streptomyces xanthophaeus TaxID=67385 RepID=A0A919H8W1_9ACTN|nr:hypothetical protein [Streptomyces xanthophaeus]GHI89694.1 hypothetical protein Sxan_70580 [Streptomyces xanthophaeus]